MASGLLSKKVWRVQDIVRREGDEEVARIIKLVHPFRKQRLTLIPTPRYAKEAYYDEWVYQPYVKEHHLYVSNDIYHPFYVYWCRFLLRRNHFPGYAYFHPMGLPDCVDVNLTRRKFIRRELPLKSPIITLLLTSTAFRDRHHPWLPRQVRRLVGEEYVVHPREDRQSMVLLLPTPYMVDVLNTLQDMGFTVGETADVSIGQHETLRRLCTWSARAQWLVLLYLWLLIAVFVVGESRHVNALFQDYKRDLIRQAGKDPAQFGL